MLKINVHKVISSTLPLLVYLSLKVTEMDYAVAKESKESTHSVF